MLLKIFNYVYSYTKKNGKIRYVDGRKSSCITVQGSSLVAYYIGNFRCLDITPAHGEKIHFVANDKQFAILGEGSSTVLKEVYSAISKEE